MDSNAPHLTRRAIDELKAIYREEYGKDLPDDEAWEMGNRLVRVFAILARRPAEALENREIRTAFRLTDRGPAP